MPGPARHRSLAKALAWVYAALVVYASLYPFTDWRWPPGQALPALAALKWSPWADRFDGWTNALGYVPLGALILVAALRTGSSAKAATAWALLLPPALSFVSEVTQQFLPTRHATLNDFAFNTLGASVGALLASAAHSWGWIDRWSRWRHRWFEGRAAGALALLALWPFGLLFPTPAPLGLGQVTPRLQEWSLQHLAGVPWAEPVYEALSAIGFNQELSPLGEGLSTALGLLGPTLLAYSVVAPGIRRLVLAGGAVVMGIAGMTLSAWLNFGPEHAMSWVTPRTGPAFAAAGLLALLALPVSRALVTGLALMVLVAGVIIVAQAPEDPYFAQALQAWEQGRFVRFHGLAQWLGWLWPFAAMAWLLARLAGLRSTERD